MKKSILKLSTSVIKNTQTIKGGADRRFHFQDSITAEWEDSISDQL